MNCQYHPEVPASAFCQFCGKPLCKECVHNVGGAVYCEACLAERLRAASSPASGVAGGGVSEAGFSTGTPHPVLAGLLGCIPGVGAMYNGQYAKAIAHVLIFAVLASLGDKSSIFGILVAAWAIYQIFDAYQTAIARRDALPLPNPFGLNDIAQRLGIHPHPGSPNPGAPFWQQAPPVPPPSAASNWEPAAGTPSPSSAGFVPQAGAPYSGQPGYTAGQSYTGPGYSSVPGYNNPSGYTPGYPPVAGQPYAPMPPYPPFPARRDVPVGAIVLIGLGILFLFGSLGLLHEDWVGHAWPLLIIGLGVWIIIRRTRTTPLAPVNPPGAPLGGISSTGSVSSDADPNGGHPGSGTGGGR